jgi:hypothetical protein
VPSGWPNREHGPTFDFVQRIATLGRRIARRLAVGLVLIVFLAGSVTIAGATGWGGSSYDGGASHVQYKKKKLCDFILWLYKYSHDWSSSAELKTSYGWHTIAWLVKYCLEDEDTNTDPEAKCSGSPNPVYKYRTVTWSGSGSSDPGGAIVKYEWDLDGNGTYEKTGSSVTTSYSSTGTKTARLRVTDDDGAKDTTTCSVYVKTYH